jgi:hypothetical protein
LSLSLSKNILISLWNPKVHHYVHKSPPLGQLNPVRRVDPCVPKVQLDFFYTPYVTAILSRDVSSTPELFTVESLGKGKNENVFPMGN